MGEDDVEKDIKKAMAGTQPAAAPVSTSTPQSDVEADIQKAMQPSSGEQVVNPYATIGQKKLDAIDDVDRDILSTAKTPEQINQIPKHLPLTEEQLRTKFDHERSLPWNEGMRTTEDWYNIGKEVVGSGVQFAKGLQKFAEKSLFSGAEEDPSGFGRPSLQPTKDFVSSAVQLPEDVAYFGAKLMEGGWNWTDRLSETFGVHDKEKSFENYKARQMVDMVHAQQVQETPTIYGRILKGETYNKALSAVILNSLPDTKSIMQQYGLDEEKANAKRREMADQIAHQTTSELAAQEKPADEDIALAGSFAMPAGLGLGTMGAVGLAAEGAMRFTPNIVRGLKYLGKTDAEIKAMNDAVQAASKAKAAEKIEKAQQPSAVGKAAGALAGGVEKLTQAAENAPEVLKKIAPYAIGGALGYESNQEHPLYGALVGSSVGHAIPVFKGISKVAKIPALVRDIDEARAIAAGGSKGTFETLGALPDVSERTAQILRSGGKNLDNIIDNSVEYAKAGIHPTLLALATGSLESASPEERNKLLSTGLLYGFGGRALHHVFGKITGVDPVIEQRERRQQAVDDYKTYQSLDPETQKTMNGLTSWDNEIKRQQNALTGLQTAYADAVSTGSADAAKLGNEVIAQEQILSAVMRANVQTRNEYARRFVTQLTKLNELTNGTLRAGQNNVGVHIMTPDQIFAKFRQDPANNAMTDAEIKAVASQQGFYSTPEGAVEYQAGMPMGGIKKNMIFDRTTPSIVINADHMKARQQIFGETPIDTLTHEFGHHIRNIPEFREANRDAEDLLFSQEIKDLSGKVTATTSGRYSPKDLVEMYINNYNKGKTPDQVEQLSRLAGLWDDSRGALNEQAVADYMKDEIVAQLNAGTLSSHLGKDLDSGALHLLDVASLKTKKNLLDRAVQKFFGLGGQGSAVDPLTGAEFSPELLAANRQAMRALKALQGEVSPAVKAPDAPKISRALMMKTRAIREKYVKYSGLLKTKMQGQVYDAAGNPVGTPVEITNPSAAEGAWATDRQLSGYGPKPDEVSGAIIPEGGRLVVSKAFVTEADGVTPAMYTPKEAKALQKARKNTILQALDTPDHGTPNRFEPVTETSETSRGTFTPLQIQAIKDLPEGIIPKSIKDHILKINEAIVRGDGSRLLVDYAAVMNDAGKYTAFSPKIYDVVPIGMHLSKDGNFLVTTISVGRMFEKLNAWSQRMPARLSPWGGDKNAFFKEFTEKYLQNWQNGLAGETGLAGTPAEALAKKNIFNDFLNLTTKDFRDANEDRTRTPRQRGDVRGKDMDRTILSMRLDHMAELMDNEYAPKVPVDYGKAIRNFMPSAVEQEKYPTSESGFYSGLQKAVDEKMPTKASPQQVLQIVNNPQNAKPEEVKWSNIAGFLDGKKTVTKQEVLDYLKNEGSVKFQETQLWSPSEEDINAFLDDEAGQGMDRQEAIEYLTREYGSPKHSQYVLPNGENYREVVLTMPTDKKPEYRKSFQLFENGELVAQGDQRSADRWKQENPNADIRELQNALAQKQPEGIYTSSHFTDIPNYVAHMRLNERKDAAGNDGLFIEELQSDRHQQGRERGYAATAEEKNELADLNKKARESGGIFKLSDAEQSRWQELNDLLNQKNDTGIPDAPFRKDWSVQMFKRALRDAIASGKEWIGWTSGNTQAERYDLSKQVRFIAYNKVGDKIGIIAKDHNFQTIIAKSYNPSELPDVIGKEVAQKIINGEGTEKKTELSNGDVINMKHLSGVDLKIGGEGMKGFYDQILPKEIGKYVKKWGAKVEEGDVKTDPKEYDTTPIWKVAITPEMRDSIQRSGQIQFMPDVAVVPERYTGTGAEGEARRGKYVATTGIQFMPASAEIREEGTPQHLEFWNRELENSGIKAKPATMAALDSFIHNYVQEKYYTEEGQPAASIFPQIDPEKIKNYYQKAVRNATPEQAADFPPDWLRIRNMSQQEFDSSFNQDKVDQITQFRVNALAKSANYLLGEMKDPKTSKKWSDIEDKVDYIYVLDEEGEAQKASDLRDNLEEEMGLNLPQIEAAIEQQRARDLYNPSEVAAILNASSKFRVNAGYNEEGEMVPLIQNISNGNEAVPNEVSGATASKIAEYMRQGMSSKDAYTKGVFDVIKARAAKRGVFTGWKKYDQSSDMGEAEKLNADCAGTNWCTGGSVGTANSHLSGGDFYLYFDQGEPQVAIRTQNGEIAEVRGRGDSQNITKPEYDKKAEEFILGGEGPEGGADYLHDRNFRKMAVDYIRTGVLPESAYRYYDQDGAFMEPRPKMSYSSVFEKEYTEPFITAQLGEILDSEGNLKTSLRYNPRDPKNINYKTIGGDITGPKILQLGNGYDVSLPNIEQINGGIVLNSALALNLPKLKSVDYIYAKNATDVDIKNLESCKSIQLDLASQLIVPKLKEIERIIHADEATVIDLRSLTKAKGLRFAQLMDEAKKINLRNLEECPSLEINVGYGGSLDLPKLKKSDSFHVKTFSAGVNPLSGEVYVPKLEKPERTLIETSVLESTKDVYLAMATDARLNGKRPEKFTWIDSETGKVYKMRSPADFADLARAFLGQPIQTFDGIISPEELLKIYEVETQSSRDRAQGVQFMPAREPEKERITSATYTNPRTGEVTEGATHLIANPSAPQEATDRESPAYGFKTSSGGIVDRATAYQIAKDAGQLKTPTTEEEKFHADRGILHSGMYEPKGGISFMPADADHASAVERGDMEEAQKLVDDAAKKAGYQTGWYHGTASDTQIKVPAGGRGVSAHLTKNKEAAADFAKKSKEDFMGGNPRVENWSIQGDIFDPRNKTHLLRIIDAVPENSIIATQSDFNPSEWKNYDWGFFEENEDVQQAIRDAGFSGYLDREEPTQKWGNSVAMFHPEDIKSADPATYDDQGNLIPLSQRFNPTSNDIRFMPSAELPKTDDGKIDWAGFKLKTAETAKPLAGLGLGEKQNNEPEISKQGHVFPKDISKPFQFTKNVAINFMPATAKVDLEDYADYPIIALTADRMGIGQAFVGPQGAKHPLSIPRQGGAGFSTLYTDEEHNPVWGFSDEATANRFQKRVDDVAAEAGTSSVLVAPTLLSSDNHLHNLTGQMAYSEAIDAAMKSGLVDKDTINAHVQEIANRIATSKNAKQPQAMRDKFGKIKTYADLKKAITEGSLNFADAAWLKEKAGMRTLPIKAEEMQRLGILPSEVAKDLVHEGFYNLPNFSVVSLFEVPAGQKAEKGEYHKSYPYIVRGKAIGYLKNIYNLANLTSDPKVRTKSGEITAQPVMVVMPKLDPVLVKNALSTLKQYTPQSK